MTRIYLLVALAFCYVSNSALSEPATWLMQGDIFTDEEAKSRFIQLFSYKDYFSVNTTVHDVFYAAPPGKLINCVVAAAVYQNGRVSVAEGGPGTERMRMRYVTENGKPDVFFIFVQFATREFVHVEGDVAWNRRLGIVYEPMRNWTLKEIQEALRNVTSS